METDTSHKPTKMKSSASEQEINAYENLRQLLDGFSAPQSEYLANLGLFLSRPALSRILFMHELYQKVLDVHGIIVEFGVRWGQNMALFSSLRNIYEPHNYSRKLVGFDTFEGFPSVSAQDGASEATQVGAYAVGENYEDYLENVLLTHEQLAPRSHLKKFELVKGDVNDTLPKYLEKHPETIIAMAYFDMDLYEPTKKCLEYIRPYCTKGTVIGFDELALPAFPGETVAVREVEGLRDCQLRRSHLSQYQSYTVVE